MKEKKKTAFDFCKACHIIHDDGRLHKYFPEHQESLSKFLLCFSEKINEARYFLVTPILLNPEFASHNRFSCNFCNQDIDELSSTFASANAIRHLASTNHMENVQQFFDKHACSNHRMDAYVFSDEDLAKWETECLQSEESHGPMIGPLEFGAYQE